MSSLACFAGNGSRIRSLIFYSGETKTISSSSSSPFTDFIVLLDVNSDFSLTPDI